MWAKGQCFAGESGDLLTISRGAEWRTCPKCQKAKKSETSFRALERSAGSRGCYEQAGPGQAGERASCGGVGRQRARRAGQSRYLWRGTSYTTAYGSLNYPSPSVSVSRAAQTGAAWPQTACMSRHPLLYAREDSITTNIGLLSCSGAAIAFRG